MAPRATPAQARDDAARKRVIISGVDPEIDCGTYPAKGVLGDAFVVEADAFTDGHDKIRCVLLYRREGQRKWREVEMEGLGNDRWRGIFTPDELGRFVFTVEAWVDRLGTWRHDLAKRLTAGQDVRVELEVGAGIVEEFGHGVRGTDGKTIRGAGEKLRRIAAAGAPPRIQDASPGRAEPWPNECGDSPSAKPPEGPAPTPQVAEDADSQALATLLDNMDGELGELLRRSDPRALGTRYGKELPVEVDRVRAAFSAWYEFFPRSTGQGGKHGTFADAEKLLPYVRGMGFDVVYLPPIHPIGRTKRKGMNNAPDAGPYDVGSPWGIGAEEGGHDAVHPELGTLEDFRRFREKAESLGLEVALDIAFQSSPDHPWAKAHPEWFRHRPDGSIRYAENPPKKYEDIYPLNFESEEWKSLWKELRRVFEHWIAQGIRIFRVDNPHTKPFAFWEWCIGELKAKWPDLIFLSEAFTRPRVMYHLAKIGFNQSYTYFAWRHHAWEIKEYLNELTQTQVRHYFRPNFWPNTPDILTETLQTGGRPAYMMRLVLAATLSSNYGIYGPAFELMEHAPREHGSEEYLDSEKYELKSWDLSRADSLRHFIASVNQIRRDCPALQRNDSLYFHGASNDALLVYSKRTPSEILLCVVNLDPRYTQSGWTDLHIAELGLGAHEDFEVHDMLSEGRYLWRGGRNYVELNPHVAPAHVFRVILRGPREKDSEYHG
jgi:starch synthase (maltosyl-transferring)